MSKQTQPTPATGNVIVGYTSAYDAASNRLSLRALHAPSRSLSYEQHDPADRMRAYLRGILAEPAACDEAVPGCGSLSVGTT